jgi:hypothetical protein
LEDLSEVLEYSGNLSKEKLVDKLKEMGFNKADKGEEFNY